MHSPFPGMDPYLEGSLWITVHHQLSAEIARQLAPRLRPRYLALTNERFVTEIPEGVAITTAHVYPDAGVVEARKRIREGTIVEPAPLRLATLIPDRVPHITIEIRDVANRELVTAIEVLSPTNKRGEGRQEYLDKRHRLLLSPAHLMEIDLLRAGSRVPMERDLPPAAYFVFLSRFETRPMTEVWPIQPDQHLPTVPVPLLEGDPDVPLDLQTAFTTVYDSVGYDLAVDYTKPPEVPLDGEWAAWAEARMREWREAAGASSRPSLE